jgi:hypothetical protein
LILLHTLGLDGMGWDGMGSNAQITTNEHVKKSGVLSIEIKKAFITMCSTVAPLPSTNMADSGLASEFRWDRAIYATYERMLILGVQFNIFHTIINNNSTLIKNKLLTTN